MRLKIQQGLVFSVCNQGIQMIVFAPRWLGRTRWASSLADPDAHLQSGASVTQSPMTETSVCCLEDVWMIRNDLNSKSEWIESLAKGQIHIAKKSVRRSAH